MQLQTSVEKTDILIIGGGTAGCYAAITLANKSKKNILILEKANIKRSGCLAAGVNAINAYIVDGNKPQDYVDYATNDADKIVRKDLLLSMANRLNDVTKQMEELGLVILKDKEGNYVARGNRNIKINGENIKPLLAKEVQRHAQITVKNHVQVIDYIVEKNVIYGAIALDVKEEKLYVIKADMVLCATGGASGLYRPNNPGFSRNKMWYPPFNTGAGYAMGMKHGAEMTTFEMRFIALRCKDTIAPTGTIAQGVKAHQINALGEEYETKYGLRTSERIYGTVMENLDGRGPCYLQTSGISKEQEEDLKKAYLNMAPSQTLRWIDRNLGPREEDVEIEGTEPYVVGGHTASGYWVDTKRETTIHHLYAAGDVAGGCPQKYVTGALAEGEIAANAMLEKLEKDSYDISNIHINYQALADKMATHIEEKFKESNSLYTVEMIKEAMQKIMDQYAGGIATNYEFNEKRLDKARNEILKLQQLLAEIKVKDMHELMSYYELEQRLLVCETLIVHLKARKETRWHSFAENKDYPNKSQDWEKYVNTKKEHGKVKVYIKDLVKGDSYEHTY